MKNKLIYSIILLITCAFCFVGFSMINSGSKTGYILIGDVFSKFQMKKDLEKKYEEVKNQRQRILDSLAIQLRVFSNDLKNQKTISAQEEERYNYLRQDYIQKKQQFDEDNKQMTGQYDKQILTQLNQYVREYGKQNGYQYIFGSDGNGSLMYAEQQNDISKPVIEFINNKYNGKQ